MATSISPVRDGTLIHLVVFIIIILTAWLSHKLKFITKSSFQIIRVVATIFGVATWLLWLCAWMHQWHPLITPEWKHE